MKKAVLTILFAAIVLCACGKQPDVLPQPEEGVKPMSEALNAPEGSVMFTIKNNIGGDIYEIRIAPSETDEYGEDILKNKILKSTESAEVSFLPSSSTAYYDLRVLGESGNYYIWYNIQFGNFSEITLEIGDNGPVFSTN
ncbi:MAG: hypothetical protein IJT38_01035 [Clostridia bacterium]|nr:hypothetical protein [Clostridia bacterium]